MTVPRAEKVYEKHAWILLLLVGIITLIVGLSVFFGPAEYFSKILIGTFGSGMGIFSLAITLKPYRRGEKWAWYALWYWPVFFLVHVVALGTIVPDVPIFVVALLRLLLPYRKFFPKK